MSVTVHFIEGSPLTLKIREGLTIEDVCELCCKSLEIFPLARCLFALQKENSTLYSSPSELITTDSGVISYNFRCRFWPSSTNLSKIGLKALHYLFTQVKADYAQGKIAAFNDKLRESEALGLGVAAMYCYIQDYQASINDVLSKYSKFLPETVCKNCYLSLTQKSLRKKLKQVVDNPPELMQCKEEFLKKVIITAPEYTHECYPVKVECGDTLVDYELLIQPMDHVFPGIKLRSTRKKPDQNVCGLNEICFISVRKDVDAFSMEIARINGVPQYIWLPSEEMIRSCVSGLNGYYRLSEKWTFDLCTEFVTPSLTRLKSLKCHGPIGDAFAYSKLKQKRRNKQGCFILRENQSKYDELCLDVCLKEGDQASTFIIEKTAQGFRFKGFNAVFSKLNDLLVNHSSATDGILQLSECLPSSENDFSDLLLCRNHFDLLAMSSTGHKASPELPICLPPKSIQLYGGLDMTVYEFHGRFTIVQRGVWNRGHQDRVPIARKLLKRQFQSSHTQSFLESVQRSMFWTCETIVRTYGIILDSPLSVIFEYLPLGPLDQYLQQCQDDLEVIDLVEAATNLAKALFYLEENEFVHGNIRCRNAMVASRSCNSIRVKLADPGIFNGTEEELPWIPIEMSGSWKNVSRTSASDIWAFGTTLWEIFSYGKKPCSELSEVQVTRAFRMGWRPPIPEKCPDQIYQIMLNTWTPDIHLRPKAQVVMRDVNRILYEVFNSRRKNAYDLVKEKDCLDGSLASGMTDATTLRAISIDQDNVSIDSNTSHFDDTQSLDPKATSLSFLLSTVTLDDESSLSVDGEDEYASQIYELDRRKLELGQIIGQGHYGEVRMGVIKHSDGPQETVAVKKLKGCIFDGPESMDLQRECAIMKSLRHPNIVEVKAILTESSTMLVMEYVVMGSLWAYLHEQKDQISNSQLLKFATDVAEGMEYLGQKNIVHRDLAARNILVASEDSVKISDFGLARHVGYSGYYVVQRNDQTLPIRWYSPESLAYWKFSSQSDVWSYGVTLFEMFSRGDEPELVSGDHTLLLQALQQGRRLPRPMYCPLLLYRDLMQPCWNHEANQRPSFTTILNTLRCVQTQI